MSTTGYSGTPLIDKLGIKPSMKLLLINAPEDYFRLVGVVIQDQVCKKNGMPDIVHLFVKNKKEFEASMKTLKSIYLQNTSLVIWVSWYKKASKIATDITEDTIRNYALQHGLVDVKVCSVSEVWSGLKLVVPLKLR